MSTTASRAVRDTLGTMVTRTAALPPATGASDDLFSITGEVLITSFYGFVEAAIPNESLDWTLDFDPDSGAADIAMATLLAVDDSGVNTWFRLNSTPGGALVAHATTMRTYVVLDPALAFEAGDIKLTCAGGGAIGTTARVRWGLTYLPLSSDGAVVAV